MQLTLSLDIDEWIALARAARKFNLSVEEFVAGYLTNHHDGLLEW